jgi:hypothetical protein
MELYLRNNIPTNARHKLAWFEISPRNNPGPTTFVYHGQVEIIAFGVSPLCGSLILDGIKTLCMYHFHNNSLLNL